MHIMDNKDISITRKLSSRLRQERERHGWSQSELAIRVGTNQVTISRWEKGITVPSPYFRQKLGEIFEKSLEELGLFTEEEARLEANANVMPLWNIPYQRNPFFTSRESILIALHAVLNNK